MKAIKQADVVISAVGHALLGDQVRIIAAIKEAGNVKVYQLFIFNSPHNSFRFGGGMPERNAISVILFRNLGMLICIAVFIFYGGKKIHALMF